MATIYNKRSNRRAVEARRQLIDSGAGAKASSRFYQAPQCELFGKSFTGGVLAALNQVSQTRQPVPTTAQNTVFTVPNLWYEVPAPINFAKTISLKDLSTHHSACIQTKKFATVGLGFYGVDEIVESGKSIAEEVSDAEDSVTAADIVSLLTGNERVNSVVDEELDPKTFFGFANELDAAVEDFMDTGTGYLEVSRGTEGSDEITGIRHIPVGDIRPVIAGRNLFYRYIDPHGDDKYFALFGRKDELFEGDGPYAQTVLQGTKQPHEVSEVITFMLPSNRATYYGYPDWLAAAADIDLTAKAKQYKADFYHNRGVLDFIVSCIGTELTDEQFDILEGTIKCSAGAGNNWRGAAFNLAAPEAKIEVHKLAMEMNTEQQFASDSETLSQNIVSAHRVPPLLANILIPGKLGATNELINSLIGFQLLVVGPYQQIIQSQLGRTLGNPELNGGLELTADSFRLRTVTSQINITGLDAVSRSRTEATTEEDRDFSEGVKE